MIKPIFRRRNGVRGGNFSPGSPGRGRKGKKMNVHVSLQSEVKHEERKRKGEAVIVLCWGENSRKGKEGLLLRGKGETRLKKKKRIIVISPSP